jgi:hypothetical protein
MARTRTIRWALLFLAVGVAITAIGVHRLRIARASADWPSVTGTILTSEVESRHRSADATGTRLERGYEYLPRVKYQYRVDGAVHRSTRITFDDLRFDSAIAAQAVADRYAPGSEVPVHYDPAQPDRAILEPGLAWTAYLLPAFGIVLTLSTIAAWMFPALREENMT